MMMKRIILIGISIIGIVASPAVYAKKKPIKNASDAIPANAVDSASYALGIDVGKSFQENLNTFPGGEINKDVFFQAFKQAFFNDDIIMTPEEARIFLKKYIVDYQKKVSEQYKADGEKFLAENKNKDGVITTESGLQYKILTAGSGEKPTISNSVKVNYTGKLIDGTIFDQSQEPVIFRINDLIEGFKEALLMMPVGSKYQIWIPSELGYGDQKMDKIKPHSVLDFTLEILEITK